jgi:F0F1-type ATP synthase assembly protein I
MLIFITALDTTWRAFIPTLGGVFLGIGIDRLFNLAPVGTIVCLAVGVIASALLIAKQLRDVRKPLK